MTDGDWLNVLSTIDSTAQEDNSMNKIALVTGASRGLGRNAALAIARKGHDVVVTYRTGEAEARQVVAEIERLGQAAIALKLDVGDVSSFAAFATALSSALHEVWGRADFDFLINNAGHGAMAAFAETTEQQFDDLFNVHVKGVFFLTQALLPLIRDGGRIVNYSFLGGAVRDMPDLNAQFAGMTALGRVGVPDDIGPMVASLLAEDNRWVTGQRIEVSGGQVI
jgi:NAD(P)-dependent dehydrogenase (short-subunit alcohol dehydrogenase family)